MLSSDIVTKEERSFLFGYLWRSLQLYTQDWVVHADSETILQWSIAWFGPPC